MKNEAGWKRHMVDVIHKRGHYARRIEDQFSVGFPDLIIIIGGHPPVFAEVKIVRGKQYAPSPRQFIELKRLHQPPHSLGMVIGVGEDRFHFSKPVVTAYLSDNDMCHSIEFWDGLVYYLNRAKETRYYV